MAPMSLFCTRFLKSLLVKEDADTQKPQEPQNDDDEDEQMHSDDDWTPFVNGNNNWKKKNRSYSMQINIYL